MTERVDATSFDAEDRARLDRIRVAWGPGPGAVGYCAPSDVDWLIERVAALEAAEHWRDVWKTTCDAHLVVLGDMQAELRKHVPADHDLLHPDAVELAVGLREEMRQALEAAEKRECEYELTITGLRETLAEQRAENAELRRERGELAAQANNLPSPHRLDDWLNDFRECAAARKAKP